jgi:hypothetical protein
MYFCTPAVDVADDPDELNRPRAGEKPADLLFKLAPPAALRSRNQDEKIVERTETNSQGIEDEGSDLGDIQVVEQASGSGHTAGI